MEKSMDPFPTTVWTHVRSAKDGDSSQLSHILVRYRAPIVGFLRRKGVREDLAEDLAQEVLIRVFRTLLLSVTRHVLSEELKRERALRRGGDAKRVESSALIDQIRGKEDPVFDQLWVRELVEFALRGLDDDSKQRGLPLSQAFRLKYLEGLSQEDVAERLGCGLFNAKNHIYYGKLKFKELLLAAIKDYCATPEEYEDELRRLSPYLGSATA
jgi:DNA-directed RNA polymerase specialized sigma24 family protein